jgi:predicted enzyme related to lactoylglutathione lyase/ketosteroid isomerase-like protein
MSATTFYDFITAINAHDPNRLHALMSDDHTFVDAIGNRLSGADKARSGWTKYFHMFPDYTVELTDALETSPTILATGFASGTYQGAAGGQHENHWRIPAAWKAVITEERVTLWQVFADTKIPFDIMDKATPKAAIPPLAPAFPRPSDEPGDKAGKRVTGLGGVFFICKDPEAIRAWYHRHLGLHTDVYGTNFAWKHNPEGQKKGYTAWSPFPEDTTYFAPSDKTFMFNYRVRDIEQLVGQLKAEGVTVLDAVETYPYGKFVHILDPENNKVELWQADDETYATMLTAVTY